MWTSELAVLIARATVHGAQLSVFFCPTAFFIHLHGHSTWLALFVGFFHGYVDKEIKFFFILTCSKKKYLFWPLYEITIFRRQGIIALKRQDMPFYSSVFLLLEVRVSWWYWRILSLYMHFWYLCFLWRNYQMHNMLR